MTTTLFKTLKSATLALAIATTLATAAPAADMTADEAFKDIAATLGGVPSFLAQFPKGAVPGAWQEVKALQFSGDTALTAREKALISLAVSAQIPCSYCIYDDTLSAKRAGATDEQIAEAVAVSALTRHWSTWLNGMQVDLAQFKKEVGGN